MFAHAVVDLCADFSMPELMGGCERTYHRQTIHKMPTKMPEEYVSQGSPEREQSLSETTYQCH